MPDSIKWPAIALAGGAGADMGTTAAVIKDGKGHEANPLFPDNLWALGAAKAGIGTAEILAMKFLNDHGHPNIAKALGYGGAAVGALAALHNAKELDKRR